MVAGLTFAWVLFVGLPRWYTRSAGSASAPSPVPTAHRTIKAKLFYAAAPGAGEAPQAAPLLVGVERDVPLGATPLEQAELLLLAQLAEPPPADLVSTIPKGTTLRAVYLTERGEAFVDLSPEASAAHPGGSLNEILTVYTIVHVLAANLPAVRSVQILVDGREVETLAGHVDLRRPLLPDRRLIREQE